MNQALGESSNGETDQSSGLLRVFKLRHLFTMALGTIIGAGWITVLGIWLGEAGSIGAIIAFAAGGLAMLLVGLCYAEAATMYPVAGGEIAYGYAMSGPKMAFLVGWLLALNYTAGTAFQAIAVAWILGALIPGFDGPPLYSILGGEVHLGGLAAGLALMAVVSYLNYRGANKIAIFQDITTYGLFLVATIVIIAGISFGDVANLQPYFSERRDGWPLFGVFAVFATTPFWFSGFDTIPQAMGENALGDRLRLVPRVIILAIGSALVFYCLIILSASMAMPRDELLRLDLPTAGVFEALFHSTVVGKIVLTAGLCGLLSTWNAAFFATTRLIYALGRARLIPSSLGQLHKRFASPHYAVVFVTIVCILVTLLGRKAVVPIVQTGAACMSLVFLIVSVGIIRLRATEPDRPRPYRLHGGMPIPILAGIIAAGMLYLAIYEPYRQAPERGIPTEWWLLVVWLTLGIVFWFWSRLRQPQIAESERRRLILE